MKKVLLIHGFGSTPNGGWRPYLMAELEKHNTYAYSLPMPKPSEPLLSEWISEVKQNIDNNPDDEIYLVGHSLGGTTILRYLEQFNSPNLKGVVIASAPCHQNANNKISGFLKTDFHWALMKNKVQKVVVIQGDNDPNVPMSDAEEIAKELGGKLIIIPNGKHLNGSAGYTKLPEAFEAIINMMK